MDLTKYFNILELKPNSSKDDIKKAYKKLAIKYHPDKQNNKSDEEKIEAEQKFKEIAEAYDILMNPEKQNNIHNFNYRSAIDPNELFQQFFNMNFNSNRANPFSSQININLGNMGGSNTIMRSSSVSIINGKRIEKITETINGVTRVKTIVSDPVNGNFRINL